MGDRKKTVARKGRLIVKVDAQSCPRKDGQCLTVGQDECPDYRGFMEFDGDTDYLAVYCARTEPELAESVRREAGARAQRVIDEWLEGRASLFREISIGSPAAFTALKGLIAGAILEAWARPPEEL